jgi:hypothetical protein
MHSPSSVLRRTARRVRHPSPAMVVAGVALFMSLGGASYAATTLVHTNQIHNWAITNAKIANNAVTFNKIKPSSVGVKRVVKSEVQLRLRNVCASGQAMTAVDVNGNVTCAPAMSSETNSAAAKAVDVSSPTTAATVSSLSLPAGTGYTVQANPYITVTPSTDSSAVDQHVVVTCTLTAGTAAAQRSATFDLPAASDTPAPQVQNASIPLVAVAPSNTAATAAEVSCVTNVTDTSGSNAGKAATHPATATAQGQIYATDLASEATGTTVGTTTTTTTTGTTTTTTPAP